MSTTKQPLKRILVTGLSRGRARTRTLRPWPPPASRCLPGSKSSSFNALICTTSRRIPASARKSQGPGKDVLNPLGELWGGVGPERRGLVHLPLQDACRSGLSRLGFGIWVCRFWGLVFGIWVCRPWRLVSSIGSVGFEVWGLVFSIWVCRFWGLGFGFGVWGLGFGA